MRPINLRKDGLKHPRICVIAGPFSISIFSDADVLHINSFLHILEPLSESVFLITGNFPGNAANSKKIHIENIKHRSSSRWMFVRIPKFIIMQIKISYHLIKIGNKIDTIFFSIGAIGLFLPMIAAKVMRKKVILIHPGVDAVKKTAEITYRKKLIGMGGRIILPIVGILERLSCALSNKIIVYSPDLTQTAFKRYVNKISMNGSRFFVDDDHFKVEKDINSRENVIGYFGRLSEIKGVMNFIKAIPLISGESAIAGFVIGGDGALRDEIEKTIKDAKLEGRVKFTGWISHDKLPEYLNEMKLVVIPSYTEVGPQLLFEAMACGTPVLATPVGVVHDVIRDEKNGFIMESNSPECIAGNVVKVLNYSRLDKIAKNARDTIEREYTYEATVERYRNILKNL
jgi:glycosyltransferase involved in cell wall biosynthesis